MGEGKRKFGFFGEEALEGPHLESCWLPLAVLATLCWPWCRHEGEDSSCCSCTTLSRIVAATNEAKSDIFLLDLTDDGR